ncbi:glycosyltransferase family 2 protein [Ectothiorhodospira marina]|nr:glycosyltransferase family 2 protein [Ectothiorhodospira marina]
MTTQSPDNLTVVIPLYNKARTIRRAILSVSGQLDNDDTIIVVDDGSLDDSAKIVNLIADPRVHLVQQENQGVSAARNLGLQIAKTDHVAFLDADDWWLPGAAAQFKRMIRKHPECLMYCIGHTRQTSDQKFTIPKEKPPEDGCILEGSDFIRAYARRQLINSSTSCVKKSSLAKIGCFPVQARSGEDIYIWLRMALLGNVAVSHRVNAVVERDHPGNAPKRDDIPYHIKWLSSSSNRAKLSHGQRQAVRHFIFYRGLNMCAGEVLAGRRKNAYRQAQLISEIHPSFFLFSSAVIFSPRITLRLLYWIKQRRKTKIEAR